MGFGVGGLEKEPLAGLGPGTGLLAGTASNLPGESTTERSWSELASERAVPGRDSARDATEGLRATLLGGTAGSLSRRIPELISGAGTRASSE